MLKTIALMLPLLTTTSFAQTEFVNTLMPQPASVQPASGALTLSAKTAVRVEAADSAALRAAVERMIIRLQNETVITFAAPMSSDGAAAITIRVGDVSRTLPALGDDESYRIVVENGAATIEAATYFGALHAFETFTQLVQPRDGGYIIPAVRISDAPRFAWRGLMIDTGRHFMPVAAVERTLDGMAAVKLNVLHFHLSEDQGFRVESRRYPKLTGMGSEGEFYTQEQMRGMISYAAARGIRVVPEFDMPGHATSWFVGYPELASGPGPYAPEKRFGVFDAAMDPTRESTYEFLDGFFGEMTELFPDQYMHVGGDESNGKQWKSNPQIVAFMKAHRMATTAELQTYFNKRLQQILRKYHRTMVGWDEILQPDLPPEIVVQNWHGIEFLINGAKQGHKGLLSQPFYLDHNYTAGQIFGVNPVPAGADLTPEQTKLILGGEACMWAEQIVDATIDSRVWPRAAAFAERMWSPESDTDVADMYRRLDVESLRLDALGLQHISGPLRLQREIAGEESAPALETLAAALRPVDFGQRSRRQHNTRDTPMTNFVDAVRPDPPLTQVLTRAIEAYLHAPSSAARDAARQELERTFRAWIATGPALDELALTQPRVNQVAERRKQIVALGQLGLAALEAHDAQRTLSAAQSEAAKQLLHEAAQPSDELVDIAAAAPMQTLVEAVAAK